MAATTRVLGQLAKTPGLDLSAWGHCTPFTSNLAVSPDSLARSIWLPLNPTSGLCWQAIPV